MADVVEPRPEGPGVVSTARWSWRKLLIWSAVAITIVVTVSILFLGLFPPLIVFMVAWVVGAWLTSRGTKAGPIVLLIAFLVSALFNGPFLAGTYLPVPASTLEFLLAVFFLPLNILGLIASIMVLRRADTTESDTPRRSGMAVAGLIAVGLVVAVVAAIGYDDAVARPGDVELATEDVEFSPESLEADSGTVAVFIENKDALLHTFTIDELDVDLQIPGGASARVEFDADAGSYNFYCRPHEGDMEGTLEVK
ncbi:MAG: cupredoxin domain-containing protein [Actinomycetota bacterium]